MLGFDLVRLQPDLSLLDPDPPDEATECATTKLLNQLAQPQSVTPAMNFGLQDLGAGPITLQNEDTPGRPTHKSLTVHDKQPKSVSEHASMNASSSTHAVGGRGRSASIPLSTAVYRSPHLSTGNLMNPLSSDPSLSTSMAKSSSEVPNGSTTATAVPTLEALVAALPENALYGGTSNANAGKSGPAPLHHGTAPKPPPVNLKLKQRIKWVHGDL